MSGSLPTAPEAVTVPAAVEGRPTRRLYAAFAVAGTGFMFLFGASSAVLLPARLAEIDPAGKVGALTAVTIGGAVVALGANLVFGALSDRTRTRWGRRNPWILGGGLASALALFAVASVDTVPLVVATWALFQLALNAHVAPIIAAIPDRVPVARRGTVSACYGGGILLGSTLGQVAGGAFVQAGAVSVGLHVVPLLVVASCVAFVLLAPEPAATGARPQTRFTSLVAFPRNAPDLVWALVGRFLLMLAYYSVAGYLLYVITDYLRRPSEEAGRIVIVVSLIGAASALLGAVAAGPLSDRLGRRKGLVMVSSLVIGIAVLLPVFSASTSVLYVTGALAGVGFGIYLSVDAALMTEVLPSDDDRGKDLGILNMANTGGQMLAPVIASLTVATVGYRPLFVLAAAIAAASALCIRPIKGVA
jgi:MFS family permease